jgi:putative endonuclease
MEEKFWFVYVLGSVGIDFHYVGSTGNLKLRLSQHNDGWVQSTKHYRPLKILAFVAVGSEEKARELEKYFKTGSGNSILKKRILQLRVIP